MAAAIHSCEDVDFKSFKKKKNLSIFAFFNLEQKNPMHNDVLPFFCIRHPQTRRTKPLGAEAPDMVSAYSSITHKTSEPTSYKTV